ncbi:hypothetical protein E2562_019710 [Oryza meyeriana var. granulata]|uniref:Uncharacterized protein n=1 Tax=Oryza meyeriana var. granulata TaxID=110450 RepID=A0A6G1C6Y7_9ORYZ|nr:hypothetical protein E2562_019710 [Oryza meyeriana var. granulata]
MAAQGRRDGAVGLSVSTRGRRVRARHGRAAGMVEEAQMRWRAWSGRASLLCVRLRGRRGGSTGLAASRVPRAVSPGPATRLRGPDRAERRVNYELGRT